MKKFHRLPPWLKVIAPAIFAALCLGINAIAFTEIRQSLQSRHTAADANDEPSAVTVQNTASTTTTANSTIITNPTQAGERTTPRLSTPQGDSDTPPINIDPVLPESSTPQPATTADESAQTESAEPKYGHFPYAEAIATDMTLVGSYAEGNFQRAETLHPEAARAFLEMVSAARADGIWLVPASGYRTIAQQRTLFNAQITRKGSPEAAASVSAPPGYSEHHTGYAIDIADGSLPQNQDISEAFAETEAYQWLTAHAASHGFELSFPENNPQGIAFEPWHWRYIGSQQSRESLRLADPTLDTRNATSTLEE